MSKCPDAPQRPSKYLRNCLALEDFPEELLKKNYKILNDMIEKYNPLVPMLIENPTPELIKQATDACQAFKLFYQTNDYAASVDYPVYDVAKYGPKKEYQGNSAASHLLIHIPMSIERELNQLIEDIQSGN